MYTEQIAARSTAPDLRTIRSQASSFLLPNPRLYKVTSHGRACRCARFVEQGPGHPGLQPAAVPNGLLVVCSPDRHNHAGCQQVVPLEGVTGVVQGVVPIKKKTSNTFGRPTFQSCFLIGTTPCTTPVTPSSGTISLEISMPRHQVHTIGRCG
jgi:hypothetical protein